MPTPIDVSKLRAALSGYPEDKVKYLVDGFTHGFSLEHQGECTGQTCKNLKSALDQPKIVSEKIKQELEAGRIAGPFDTKPFDNLQLNPLGLVPNKSGDFRMIHHLSFSTRTSMSVNEGIPREASYVQYGGIDDAVRGIKSLGAKVYMGKLDIQHAFRLIPIRESDYPLLGFQWEGKFYHDRCLPMGASSSCKIFEELSSALEWILLNKLGVQACTHCLDDFFILNQSKQGCSHSMNKFVNLCSDLGIPIAHKKTEGPDTTLVFLGIEFDTVKMELRLPLNKVQKCTELLQINQYKRKLL